MARFTPTWPPEDIEQLKELFAAGKTARQIATTMGRSRGSISGQQKRSGLNRGRLACTWTPEREARMRALWAAGEPGTVIARYLGGITASGINRAAASFGLPLRDNVKRDATLAAKRASLAREARAPKVMVPRPFLDAPDPIAPLNIGFMALRNDECKWVCGTGEDGLSTHCGHPIARGSYCAGHYKIAYTPAPSHTPVARRRGANPFMDYARAA